MPRRPHLTPITAKRSQRAALVTLLAVLSPVVLTGCNPGPAKVAVPSAAPEVADACATLIKAMPAKLLDTDRRKTEPPSPLTTAYGDPPIEVTCGVNPPAGMAQSNSQCFEVNGVGWYAEQVSNGHVFTTIGRKLNVEVAVPNKYAPEANALTDVADAIKAHNTLITPCT